MIGPFLDRLTKSKLGHRQQELTDMAASVGLAALHRGLRVYCGLSLGSLLVDGAHVAYAQRKGNGVPLVGIHGFGGDKETWLLIATKLARNLGLLTVDLPGHGRSQAPVSAGTIECYAKTVIAALDHHGIERAVLCGNSMGGGVALRVAATFPQRVAGLILIDSVGNDIHDSHVAKAWIEGENPLIPSLDNVDEFVKIVLQARLPVPPAMIRHVALQRARNAPTLRRLFAEFINNKANGVPADLSHVTAPALVIHGEQDRVIDLRIAQALARTLPQAELQVLRGIGHAPQLEAPTATAKLVGDFVERLAMKERRLRGDSLR